MKNNDLKQALIKLRAYIKNPKTIERGGICRYARDAVNEAVITEHEHDLISKFILNNRPKRGKFHDHAYSNRMNYWEPFDLDIRLKWLTYKINHL